MSSLRTLLKKALPARLLSPVLARRSRRHQAYVLRTLGIEQMAEAFIARHGLVVRYGPFAGMTYTPAAAKNRVITPKLLGTYECELHEIIGKVQKTAHDTIVDIGCGEGYYTTGLALTTKARILAFDAESREVNCARAMARKNNVAERIQFRLWCSAGELIRIAGESSSMFVLSDCEGYEIELFRADAVAALRKSDVLIELHGDVKPELMRRFEGSHELTVIAFDRMNRGNRPELAEMSEDDRKRAVDECRFPQEWLWAQARS
jgi:hypothetical protein